MGGGQRSPGELPNRLDAGLNPVEESRKDRGLDKKDLGMCGAVLRTSGKANASVGRGSVLWVASILAHS